MRDCTKFIETHPWHGKHVNIDETSYTIGDIMQVIDTTRLYVQLIRVSDAHHVNYPLHVVASIMFDQTFS